MSLASPQSCGVWRGIASWRQRQQHQVRVAQASRNRAFKVYHTGDWVYVWRQQRRTHRPRWVGPCTTISHEASHSSPPRGFPNAPGRPGSIVWIISNGYILRACPEHLRPASPLEEAEALARNPEATPLKTLDELLAKARPGQVPRPRA